MCKNATLFFLSIYSQCNLRPIFLGHPLDRTVTLIVHSSKAFQIKSHRADSRGSSDHRVYSHKSSCRQFSYIQDHPVNRLVRLAEAWLEKFFTEANYEHELIKKIKACHITAIQSLMSVGVWSMHVS